MNNIRFKKWIQRIKKLKLTKKQKVVAKKAIDSTKTPGNKAAVNPNHPNTPTSHPLPTSSAGSPTTLAQHIVAYANEGLKYAGKMYYTETAARSELFGRPKGQFGGAHADCSQYVASILHWVGNTKVNKYDYTGTLLQKGQLIAKPRKGCVAIWGPGTGAHAAFVTGYANGNWYVVGFGHQGAPDRNTLAGMNEYFRSVGQPGVRFLWFS